MATEVCSEPVIMICVDDSPQAEAAFDWYCSRIHNERHKVILVSAKSSKEAPKDESDGLTTESRKKAEQLEKRFNTKLCDLGINGTFRMILSSKVGDGLVQEARKQNANCIFMGTKGRGVVKRTFKGSVSDYVLHHSHCPVFVCKLR